LEEKYIKIFKMRAKIVYENISFERGKDPKTAMDLGHFRDKNGRLIQKGDFVFADPEPGDTFYDFQGMVDGFHGKYVTVRDMDDDCFDIEAHKLEILDESLDFERGGDPKRSLRIGHSYLFPEKPLFLDIYKYCEENKFPGFQKLTPIYWNEKGEGNSSVELFFKAYVNDGSKDAKDLNFYTVYLTRTEGVISFHEYENYEGDWKKQEHNIPEYDFWRRLMEANHIRTMFKDTAELQESQEFRRGIDPKRAMDIGISSRQIFEKLSPGDIYITLENMPDIQTPKNLYILVLEVSYSSYNQRDIKYASSKSLEYLKKNYNKLGYNFWGWPFDFFKESLQKVDRIEIHRNRVSGMRPKN